MSNNSPPETALQRMVLSIEPKDYGRVARLDWSLQAGGTKSAVATRPIVVGSAPSVDVVIVDDAAVSRIHAEIDPREDGVWVRDLRSKNGTFIQGVRIESARVPHLGKVKIGSTEIVVTYGTASSAAPVDLWSSDRFGPMIGSARPMRELFARLAKVAKSDASVLVGGETGTGKELVARAIHEASDRAGGPFVVVDCAALPESLLDAELFGHAKGAFTGAAGARAGAIESADGGTVFLDEIGELPRSMQPKLLRVLEAKTVRRLGESQHRAVNVRFVSATHRDLLKMVNAGEFREDLYFRLAVLPIRLPALRERLDDLESLVRHFWGAVEQEAINPELVRQMATLPWRGNVRELRNFVDRAKTLGAREALAMVSNNTPSDEPVVAQITTPDEPAPSPENAPPFKQPFRNFRDAWTEFGEREYVRQLLERHDQNVAGAAKEAEIDRTYLYKLIRRHFR